MPQPLAAEAIQTALGELPGWSHLSDTLTKKYEFADFKEAMGFIVRVGFEAEGMNHHPELTNVYSKVTIALNTHDAGGKVTQKDLDLAKAIESIG